MICILQSLFPFRWVAKYELRNERRACVVKLNASDRRIGVKCSAAAMLVRRGRRPIQTSSNLAAAFTPMIAKSASVRARSRKIRENSRKSTTIAPSSSVLFDGDVRCPRVAKTRASSRGFDGRYFRRTSDSIRGGGSGGFSSDFNCRLP